MSTMGPGYGFEGALRPHFAAAHNLARWLTRTDHPLTNAEYPHYIFLHNHLTMVAALGRIYQEALRDPDGLLRWAADRQYDDVMEQWDKQA